MTQRKKKIKKLLQKLKGKSQPANPITLSDSEKEVARKLRKIKKDLQPGNGHSMKTALLESPIVEYDKWFDGDDDPTPHG